MRSNKALQLTALLLASGSFVVAASNANAAITLFSDEASWLGAVQCPALITFDELPANTPLGNQYSPSVTFSPVSTGIPRTTNANPAHSGANLLVDYPGVGNGGGDFRMNFSTSVDAVSFWHYDTQFAGSTVTLYDSSNVVLGTFELQYPHPVEWAFIGFTSSAKNIARVDVVTNAADFIGFDDVRFAPNANAAITLSSNESTWLGAAQSPTLITFDELPANTPLGSQYSPSVIFSPVSTGIPRTTNANPAHSGVNLLVDYPGVGNGGGDFRIGFRTPMGAVSFWHYDTQFAGSTVTLYDSSNVVLGTFGLQYPHPVEWAFIGFTSSCENIARVDVVTNAADFIGFDDLRYSSVPEPGMALLLATGVVGLAAASGRRRAN